MFLFSQAASRRRSDYILIQQLEEQKKAYDELRRQVDMLQSGQEDVNRATDGSYAELVQMKDMRPLDIGQSPLKEEADDIRNQVHNSIPSWAGILVE